MSRFTKLGQTEPSGLAAALAAIAVLVAIVALASPAPPAALRTLLFAPFASRFALGNLVNRAALLALTATGIVVALRSGAFNLGGEGQVYLGGFLAALVLAESVFGAWFAVLVAVLAGAMLAGASGYLKQRTGADEIILTFLLSAALFPIVDALIVGPLRDPTSSLLATVAIPESARLPSILPPSRLSPTFVLGIAAPFALWAVLRYTLLGYQLRITGHNAAMASYAGIDVDLHITGAMAASGALHGLTGALLVLGVHYRAIQGFSGGFGWNGIAVALIARNRPLLIVPAALFFAYLESGARALVLSNLGSIELSTLIQAIVFLFVTARIALPRLRTRSTRV